MTPLLKYNPTSTPPAHRLWTWTPRKPCPCPSLTGDDLRKRTSALLRALALSATEYTRVGNVLRREHRPHLQSIATSVVVHWNVETLHPRRGWVGRCVPEAEEVAHSTRFLLSEQIKGCRRPFSCTAKSIQNPCSHGCVIDVQERGVAGEGLRRARPVEPGVDDRVLAHGGRYCEAHRPQGLVRLRLVRETDCEDMVVAAFCPRKTRSTAC